MSGAGAVVKRDGWWYGRGRMTGDGLWHTLKTLPLDTMEPDTFCGALVQTLRRSLPAKARECPTCRVARGPS